MDENEKTREDLLRELNELRCQIRELEDEKNERGRVEHALNDQLHFLQTLIDTIPNPIFYKDARGIYLGCNKAFEARLGLEREKIVGRSTYDVFPNDMARRYHELDAHLLSRPGEEVFDASLTYADGKRHDVLLYKGTFTDSEGILAGVVGVTVDITKRKRAERALQKAHDNLEVRVAERTAELAKAVEELRVEVEERKRAEDALRTSAEKMKIFAYSVAHDLKSPAVGIYGLARLLHKHYRKLLDERGGSYCDNLMRASEHVATLVDQINIYIATKEMPLTIENIAVKDLFKMVREEFSTQLNLRRVEWIESEAAGEVRADRISLLRIFRNLVDNALKYGGEHLSSIRLGYEETDTAHFFTVEDDGAGVTGADFEKIFGLFQRRSTSPGIEGTGLGLAIVKEIAERHGGSVWVEPRPERGAVFHISISRIL